MSRLGVLVLIPESTRKASGGESMDSQAARGGVDLSREARVRLDLLRKEMAAAAASAIPDRDAFLPAYLRFQGNMYHRIPQDAWEDRAEGVEVFIVSGLYGLLASREPAVRYECSMAEALPPLGKLNRWWHDHGLPGILSDAIRAVGPKQVVDLLSLEYREAVAGFENGVGDVPVKVIDFPGMGRGSQPLRGKTVAEILRTGRLPSRDGP